ncbi:MAG: contractile injection system tape measure protein [Bacteroidota bacterium]
MSNKEIIIDQLVMDVFSDEGGDPQDQVSHYLRQVQQVILPLVATKLEQVLPTDLDVTIDRLTISASQSLNSGWQSEVSGALVDQISEAVALKCHQQFPHVKDEADPIKLAKESSRQPQENRESNALFAKGELTDLTVEQHVQFLEEVSSNAVDRLMLLPEDTIVEILQQVSSPEVSQLIASIRHDEVRQQAIAVVLRSYRKGRAVDLRDWKKDFTNQLLADASLAAKVAVWRDQITGERYSALAEEMIKQYREAVEAIDQYDWKSLLNIADASLSRFLDALLSAEGLSPYSRKWLYDGLRSVTGTGQATYVDWVKSLTSGANDLIRTECRNWKIAAVNRDHETDKQLSAFKRAILRSPKSDRKLGGRVAQEQQRAHNGGLVLLHPFLPGLFRACGLLDDQNNWHSEEQQEEAVRLLHYLATGASSSATQDYTIEKLLTGLDIEEPLVSLPVDPTFAYADKPLADMLETIREYWSPMRNNTWLTLRSEFLMRQAHIEELSEQSVLVKVLPHTMDLLLPQARWGLSMVRYSWMKHIVRVEWGK